MFETNLMVSELLVLKDLESFWAKRLTQSGQNDLQLVTLQISVFTVFIA